MDTYRSAARGRGIPRSLLAIAFAGLLFAALGPVAMAAQPEVPGNNGTVKIHEGAGEPASEMRNEPHVCTFHLHFFGADGGDSGEWEIQVWSPGDKGPVALDGDYEYAANGEDRVPNDDAFELDPGHYKLFWDGDQDTNKHDKHKVFWVECEAGQGPAEATPTPTPTPAPVVAPTPTPTPPPGGGVGPVEGTPTPTPPSGGAGPIEGTPNPTPAGGVAGATAAPRTTLPPTDTADQPTAGSAGLWATLLILFAVVMTVTLATVPVTAVKRPRRR